MRLQVELGGFPHFGLYIPKDFIVNKAELDKQKKYMVIQAWKKHLSHTFGEILECFWMMKEDCCWIP